MQRTSDLTALLVTEHQDRLRADAAAARIARQTGRGRWRRRSGRPRRRA